MTPLYRFRVCLPVVLLALVLGCGEPAPAPVAPQPQTVQVEELPTLGDPIGPLDQGRIRVAPPQGWHVPPRNDQWIVRFSASKNTNYPSIVVTAEDYPDLADVSKANVDAFARQVTEALSRGSKPVKLSQGIEPIEIGSLVGITYQRRGKTSDRFKEIVVERLFLETVVSGRKYCIELRARSGDLETYRPHLLAVVEGIEFLPPPATDRAEDELSGNESAEEPDSPLNEEL